jgi:hypothetical protein
MSVVVDHTLPFSSAELKLDDAKRWNKLLPLMRPSLTTASQQKHNILIDDNLVKYPYVQIAAIGTIGNFSSKVLSENRIAAIATDTFGHQKYSAGDIVEALKSRNFGLQTGLVVVRAGSRQDLKVHEGLGVVEIEVVGELKLDHVLSLLLSSNEATKQVPDR